MLIYSEIISEVLINFIRTTWFLKEKVSLYMGGTFCLF